MTVLQEGQAGLPSPNPTKSYWHQDPSKVLLGHRTTSDLPTEADIVIVGSGISGSFAAHFLKRSVMPSRVVMLEAREACWGATGRNGGHCQPLLYKSSADVARFELQTYNFLKDFVAEHKIDCDWTSMTGCHVYLDDDTWQEAKAAVARMADAELAAQVKVLDAEDEIGHACLFNLRVPDARGVIMQRNAASLWPYKLVCYVLEKLLADFPAPRFNLQTNTPVTALRCQDGPGGPSWPGRDNTHHWLVTTPRGTIAASQVLLCTNGYTSRLLPSFSDLIVPVRGQVAALGPPLDWPPFPRLRRSYCFTGRGTQLNRDDYLVQRPATAQGRGGDMIYGGGRAQARDLAIGEWRDDAIDTGVASYLRQNLAPPLRIGRPDATCYSDPKETELAASFEWTGIMGYSRDHHPWVGPVPESLGGRGDDGGLYICGGFTGHGMPVAALAARYVTNMMMALEHPNLLGLPREFFPGNERLRRLRETKTGSWAATLRDLLLLRTWPF